VNLKHNDIERNNPDLIEFPFNKQLIDKSKNAVKKISPYPSPSVGIIAIK
jgi:hypothetical protein